MRSLSTTSRFLIASLVFATCAFAPSAIADSGVLIPGDRQQPDPAVFSLNEMTLEIRIDNGIARVRVRQIFGNHSATVQEGVYQFALPGKATVSDFAVWDDVTRIPGVILERRRAGEIYERRRPRLSILGFCKWVSARLTRLALPLGPASSSPPALCPFRNSAPSGSRWNTSTR
jgi:hypothetical protein